MGIGYYCLLQTPQFCLDRGVELLTRRFSEGHVGGDTCVVMNNNDAAEDARMRERAKGDRRNTVAAYSEKK